MDSSLSLAEAGPQGNAQVTSAHVTKSEPVSVSQTKKFSAVPSASPDEP